MVYCVVEHENRRSSSETVQDKGGAEMLFVAALLRRWCGDGFSLLAPVGLAKFRGTDVSCVDHRHCPLAPTTGQHRMFPISPELTHGMQGHCM